MREAPLPLEDYALIGDLRSAALVGRDGAIDWLCLPRFDQPACLTALLGGPRHGTWSIAPEEEVIAVERRYRGDTLVLETVFTTADGEVALIDAMPTDLGSDWAGFQARQARISSAGWRDVAAPCACGSFSSCASTMAQPFRG